MQLFYYGDKLSPNITETPEGFLICQNVPIARTGEMQYLARELGINDKDPDRLITVTRDEKDVFDLAALASFEGKPVTDGHPNEDVEPHNYHLYSKGHIQNVRRGKGEESDKIIADLHITDPTLISEIKNNVKRQVSCGYACDYNPREDGTYYQTKIRGNHVAVVDEGRAGKTVSIKDAKPDMTASESILKLERSKPLMSKKQSRITGILHLFARSVRDSKTMDEIEELAEDAAEAIDACHSKSKDEVPEEIMKEKEFVEEKPDFKKEFSEEKIKTEDESPTEPESSNAALMAVIERLIAAVERLEKPTTDEAVVREEIKEKIKEEPEEDVDSFLSRLSSKDEDLTEEEASVTISPEEISDIPEEKVEEKEEFLENVTKDAAIRILKSARPAIASIKDAKERKRVTDALINAIKTQMNDDSMARVFDATKSAASKSANDSKDKYFNVEIQQAKYDALNPHNKKGGN